MKTVILIPARYASTRFPGKPLADLQGKPMIQWVVERCQQVASAAQVLVATDDERIAARVDEFGGRAVMTRPDHPTGTDRLAEVAETLEADLIVNVQGDEPLIDPGHIETAITALRDDREAVMATLCAPLTRKEEFLDPNVVKVVCDRQGRALYFSRAPIPWPRDNGDDLERALTACGARRHIGLYVYRRPFLLDIPRLERTPLEQVESLEQLRVLEHGYSIAVAEVEDYSIGVDTPEDLEKVRRQLA
ncbi:MAG: 3-deoxy-manno-octulosonate cytidylyltransferase [Deltaproteobacteria bacterium]|nr:MAG: 3-deoxy-manno-octulosonate cytidylyltransferase [Deltaproteobacteria bacterium]